MKMFMYKNFEVKLCHMCGCKARSAWLGYSKKCEFIQKSFLLMKGCFYCFIAMPCGNGHSDKFSFIGDVFLGLKDAVFEH